MPTTGLVTPMPAPRSGVSGVERVGHRHGAGFERRDRVVTRDRPAGLRGGGGLQLRRNGGSNFAPGALDEAGVERFRRRNVAGKERREARVHGRDVPADLRRGPRLAIAALRLVVRSGAETVHQVFVGFGERLSQATYAREVF